jgi:hypothetical protein
MMEHFMVISRALSALLLAVVFVAIQSCYARSNTPVNGAELANTETPAAASPTPEPSKVESKIPEGEATFTQAELKEYYKVYENEDVKYLRKIFDRYLANAKARDEDESDEFALLKRVDDSYFKSKFTVLSRDRDAFGNTHIMLLFSDKPDAVFNTIIYTGNGDQLRGFEKDKTLSEEDIKRIRVRYRKFIEDKKHSM